MFGSELAKAVNKSSATRWNASPYVQGAMSVAPPGAQPFRKILSEPVGSVYFAGEATHETLWGTVDGAWESGERAAEAALRRIGALREEPAKQAPAVKRRQSGGAPRAGLPGASIN
jgi:monoamine oxidase